MTTTEMTQSEPLNTTYRVRLNAHDVEAVRRLARAESHRLGVDICWTTLLRRALRKMAAEQLAIG